jgi:hypothetical protein
LRSKSGPSVVTTPSESKSATSAGSTIGSAGSPRRRQRTPRICVRCGKTITDGRWVAIDSNSSHSPSPTSSSNPNANTKLLSNASESSSSGSSSVSGREVLCEDDWKEMYLPKCRRCGLTIESHAVSSADGQLKGKYHPKCFNCTTCHVSVSSLVSFIALLFLARRRMKQLI